MLPNATKRSLLKDDNGIFVGFDMRRKILLQIQVSWIDNLTDNNAADI